MVVAASALVAQENSKNSKTNRKIVIETDSGRYGVGADKADPKQLGLAIYPGAKLDKSDGEASGISLALDSGEDSTRLYVQKFTTPDSADKILTFYRSELSRYGQVLECRRGKAVGAVPPGLKCDDDENKKQIELKAGTEKKLHLVAVTPLTSGAKFVLVYLDEGDGSHHTRL
jgi:hypothetical protein